MSYCLSSRFVDVRKIYTTPWTPTDKTYPHINFFFFFLPPLASAPIAQEGEVIYKDWVFINYTFKRFEGLTQRGIATKKWFDNVNNSAMWYFYLTSYASPTPSTSALVFLTHQPTGHRIISPTNPLLGITTSWHADYDLKRKSYFFFRWWRNQPKIPNNKAVI